DDDRHDRAAAREAAEGDALVAHVDDLHAGEDAVAVALRDVVAHQRLRRLVEHDDCGRHRGRSQPWSHQPAMRPYTIRPTICNRKTAMIGLRSSGPIGGMKRRKIDRYGSQTSRRNPSSALDQPE